MQTTSLKMLQRNQMITYLVTFETDFQGPQESCNSSNHHHLKLTQCQCVLNLNGMYMFMEEEEVVVMTAPALTTTKEVIALLEDHLANQGSQIGSQTDHLIGNNSLSKEELEEDKDLHPTILDLD